MATPPSHYQRCLKDHCASRGMPQPTWQDISDRRGGRTAWSSIAQIGEHAFSARFWYDGNYVEQAREDAAEVACTQLGVQLPQHASGSGYYSPGSSTNSR